MRKTGAIFVHFLTASGVVCTLFAFVAIADGDFATVFLWLGLALFIDAVDGPLARLVDTKRHLPRFSGERLDLIVDYLNYVALPAFIIVAHPIITGVPGMLAGAMILLSSLFHFSDMNSKTGDGYFVGFPAIWNVVVFYLFAFRLQGDIALVIILFLVFLTFVPLRWVHPFRVVKLRKLTVIMVFLGALSAFGTVMGGFTPGVLEQAGLLAAPVYLVFVSLNRTIRNMA